MLFQPVQGRSSGFGSWSILHCYKNVHNFHCYVPLFLNHRVMMCRRIVAGDKVRKLPLNIREQATGSQTEKSIVQPLIAQLFFHEDEPVKGLFSGANATSRFEANLVASLFIIIAYSTYHNQTDRKRGIDRFFACRGLDKIGSSHHTDKAGFANIAQGGKLMGRKDSLHMGFAASLTEGTYFVVESLPVTREYMGARDHNIDLGSSCFDGRPNFAQFLFQWVLTSGKARGDGSNGNIGAAQSFHGKSYEIMIDTDCSYLEIDIIGSKRVQNILAHRLTSFSAEAQDVARGIIARKCGKVDTSNGTQ